MIYQDFNIYKLKKNYSNKRIVKSVLIISNCDIMGNTNKTVMDIPKLKVGRYFVFIRYSLLSKNLTDLQNILEMPNR